VSRELLAAALRTELPDDMIFAAIPFPFDALVFMLPKGTVRCSFRKELGSLSRQQFPSLPFILDSNPMFWRPLGCVLEGYLEKVPHGCRNRSDIYLPLPLHLSHRRENLEGRRSLPQRFRRSKKHRKLRDLLQREFWIRKRTGSLAYYVIQLLKRAVSA
jgi:hypothetical protein